MGAAGGMKMCAALPHIFQKIIPLCSKKADYIVVQSSIFDINCVNPVFFFSRRHNPLWVCIHSPSAGF